MGLLSSLGDYLLAKHIKYRAAVLFSGEWAGSYNGNMDESDIIGAVSNAIATQVGKLSPQYIRHDSKGMTIRNDSLAKLLALRWAPEMSSYDALYKMAATLVRKSNAFAVVFYSDDYTRVTSIVPVTVRTFRIYEAEDGVLLFRFLWDYDGKEYVVPYQQVIHLRARFSEKRFVGTPPDIQLRSTLELIDATGQSIKNLVQRSANLKGYLKYTDLADDEEIRQKVKDFQDAYMKSDNEGGIAGLDNSMDFHEISGSKTTIPTTQMAFFRENIYRYYGVNENILTAKYNENEWNAFYEATIEPIALQLSLEFTYKLLSERERGFGNQIIFSANRLQYASLQTRATVGGEMFDRGAITINEYRELQYYPPIEGGDVRMVSLNYVKATDQSLYQTGQEEPAPAAAADPAEPEARRPVWVAAGAYYVAAAPRIYREVV